MTSHSRALALFLTAILIFGTNGVMVHMAGLPSSVIASVRGIIGAATLIVWARLRGNALSLAEVPRGELARIAVSGACIGFNWVLIFEAFRISSVAVSTVVYYIAPALVVLLAPLVLHERFSMPRLACVLVSFAGLGLIVGLDGGASRAGILLALGAACLYASVIMLNTTFAEVDYRIRTVIQIGAAGIVTLPYALATGAFAAFELAPRTIGFLLVLGIVYTGIAYACYFSAFSGLGAQEISVLSYIDPVIAVVCSALVLGEPLTPATVVGAILIIGSSIVSELVASRAAS
ncbi:MAG: DMT family transporter [Coriobacteriaceae bacterium]|nr:DMT family transporter [Coriobacteriaceae bacterium]